MLPARPPSAGPSTKPAPNATPSRPKRFGALLRRRHVGDVGEAGREARRRDAGNDAADEQPRERGRERHQDVVEAEPETRHQDHRPAAEAVGQRAEQRREQELHQRPGGAEQAEHFGRARRVATHEAENEARQHRNDDAERQHVEQHGDEDEHERRAAWCGRLVLAHDLIRKLVPNPDRPGHFGIMRGSSLSRSSDRANGLSFSRKVTRIGVPGRSKLSRRPCTR